MRYSIIVSIFIFCGCQSQSFPFVTRQELEECHAEVLRLKQNSQNTQNKEDSLSICLAQAEGKYRNYIHLNGRKVKNDPRGGDVWQAPSRVWDHAEASKRNAIEECRVLYK